MGDYENLRTASLYINNQLLSRGLLKDGQHIDFVDSCKDDGGALGTMGQIMSVVNDLILRRDRDAEHRESLSTTLRTLRAENLRQTNDIARLREKNVEAQRKAELSEAAEAASRAQLKSAEAAIRGLKEEMARAKTLVAQSRAACATEVRRRDRQIDGLKKQLADAGRARGSSKNPAVTVISVTGEIGEGRASPSRIGSIESENYDLRRETNQFLTELAKNLKGENETLQALMRKTAETLREMSGCDKSSICGDGHGVILETNCEEMASDMEAILEHLRTILTNPSFVPIEEVEVREEEINRLKDGWVKMETRWKEAVHLIDGWRRRMATSGRSVNMEELKMGLRLSPVRVKDVEETSQELGLRLSAVQEECEEEEEHPVLEQIRESPCPAESLHLVPAPAFELQEESESESSISQDDIEIEELEADEPNVQVLQQSMAFVRDHSPPLPPAPQLSPLKGSSSAGNRGAAGSSRPPKRKPGDFTTIVEENTCDFAAEADSKAEPTLPPLTRAAKRNQSPLRPIKGQPPPKAEPIPESVPLPGSGSSLDNALQVKTPSKSTSEEAKENRSPSSTREERQRLGSPKRKPVPKMAEVAIPTLAQASKPEVPVSRSPKRVASRLPLPSNANPPPQQSPLTMATIAAKLAASEREADAARVRAKLKAARGGKRISLAPRVPSNQSSNADVAEDGNPQPEDCVDPVKRDPVSSRQEAQPPAEEKAEPAQVQIRKRERRVSKVVSRRRSTLSPWELESLISGNVPAMPAQ